MDDGRVNLSILTRGFRHEHLGQERFMTADDLGTKDKLSFITKNNIKYRRILIFK